MVTLRAKRSRKNGPFYQSGHKNEGWTPVFPSPGHMYCTGVSVWTDVTHLVYELVQHVHDQIQSPKYGKHLLLSICCVLLIVLFRKYSLYS